MSPLDAVARASAAALLVLGTAGIEEGPAAAAAITAVRLVAAAGRDGRLEGPAAMLAGIALGVLDPTGLVHAALAVGTAAAMTAYSSFASSKYSRARFSSFFRSERGGSMSATK